MPNEDSHLFLGPSDILERLLVLESIVSDLRTDRRIWIQAIFDFLESKNPTLAREFLDHLDALNEKKADDCVDRDPESGEFSDELISLTRLADLTDKDLW